MQRLLAEQEASMEEFRSSFKSKEHSIIQAGLKKLEDTHEIHEAEVWPA
jgi:hypothetical protein